MIGGLLGGPTVGVLAGLIGGLHRFYLGGFTAFACALSTTLAGLIGGLVHYYRPLNRISLQESFSLGVLVEVLEMGLVLGLSKPYPVAYQLVKVIAIPMILSNSLGIVFFIDILQKSFKKEEEVKALQAYKALKIANKSICYLRDGLNYESALETAKIILQITEIAAVSITDREQVLAHCGISEGHHQAGEEILTDATKQALANGEVTLIEHQEGIGCPIEDCSLRSAVIAPLKRGEEIIGVLKLYKTTEQGITNVELELARGIARLLSTQLQISSLKQEAQLTTEAELKALQAQIHPHFLFNALNTIVSFCRTDPEQARELLLKLSKFFRKTLKQNSKLVSLEQELDYVRDYLALEKARYREKLEMIIDIPDELLTNKVPSFTLQPIIENAIKHGLAPQPVKGQVMIIAFKEDGDLIIKIEDDGVGIPASKLNNILKLGYGENSGIGLNNVNQRLKKIYGTEYGLTISSELQEGTIVKIKLPDNRGAVEKNE